jgi:lipopolysaccharide transport system ATP-binding protein
LDFTFDEKIKIKFDFVVNEVTSGLQIGIALQNKFNSRIFTVIREIEYFKKNSDNLYHGEVLFPESLIAPNNYSFVLAIWTKDGRVYDMVENILFIKIHDNGTYLANYEGIDYGSIIINPEWH